MKDQKKNTELHIENTFGMTLVINEDLNKYTGPEYRPEKMDKIEKKFSKQSELNFKSFKKESAH
ncbi:hypothetical protein [Mucilaginibacter sp. OK098]|uniref:hypothetical protein n=1 Tax=Mucilaginibacter sp. OK098 TaxID=1855297 RepID=UPI001161095B|nr:hypothetical protein [Mucilaginibacter sp. OK098]